MAGPVVEDDAENTELPYHLFPQDLATHPKQADHVLNGQYSTWTLGNLSLGLPFRLAEKAALVCFGLDVSLE